VGKIAEKAAGRSVFLINKNALLQTVFLEILPTGLGYHGFSSAYIILIIYFLFFFLLVYIPAPDYDDTSFPPPPPDYLLNDNNNASYDQQQLQQRYIGKSHIKANMSDAMKEISKDINFRSKQLVILLSFIYKFSTRIFKI